MNHNGGRDTGHQSRPKRSQKKTARKRPSVTKHPTGINPTPARLDPFKQKLSDQETKRLRVLPQNSHTTVTKVATSRQTPFESVFLFSDSVTKLFLARPFLHKLTAIIGVVLFACGGISALLWNVPLVSGFKGGDMAVSFLSMGGRVLGLWFLTTINKPDTP